MVLNKNHTEITNDSKPEYGVGSKKLTSMNALTSEDFPNQIEYSVIMSARGSAGGENLPTEREPKTAIFLFLRPEVLLMTMAMGDR